MKTILITGVSGLIGRALAESLSKTHHVIGLGRKAPELDGITFVHGEFGSFEDLRGLDSHKIDAVVHLAAVTGDATARSGLRVNVEGTRCLMTYLADRGCRKFVAASSIAAIGLQDQDFCPLEVPIPDEHPCLDRHEYGFSKFLMEEIMRHLSRQHPEIEATALRLAVVTADEQPIPKMEVGPRREWGIAALAWLPLSEAVRAFTLAVESPIKPGLRIMNTVAPKAWAGAPVAEILRNWYGDALDLSAFEQPGHEDDSVFACRRIRDELAFSAGS
jgi:nucleoside-diphosphate-sugar epimerase